MLEEPQANNLTDPPADETPPEGIEGIEGQEAVVPTLEDRVSALETKVAPMMSATDIVTLINDTVSKHPLLMEAKRLRDDLATTITEMQGAVASFQAIAEATKLRMDQIHDEHTSLSNLLKGLNKNIKLMTSLIEARSQQIENLEQAETELRKDIAVLRAEADTHDEKIREVAAHHREWEIRVGDALAPIVGRNPALPEATRTLEPMVERVQTIDKAIKTIQADLQSTANTVAALKADSDKRKAWLDRVIPAEIRERLFSPAMGRIMLVLLMLIITRLLGIDLTPWMQGVF